MDEKKRKSFFSRFLKRYIIVVYNQGNFKERISISLTPINLLLLLSSLVLFSFACGAFLIAFTPIKEAIPGFGNSYMSSSKVLHLQNRVDSFERVVSDYNVYFDSLKKVLRGDTSKTSFQYNGTSKSLFHFASYSPTRQQPLIGSGTAPNHQSYGSGAVSNSSILKSSNSQIPKLFPPVEGYISQHFDPGEGHNAMDIITAPNEPVKAVDDGTVIFSEWSAQTGNNIIIQHPNNLVSIYKHNSVLLKKVGTFVSRGDVIALVGNSGEFTTGPHLHFELWINGSPTDPEAFISF
jgi:murein DD-endopeptidase MepM/ murein hydrolase activator NlpD